MKQHLTKRVLSMLLVLAMLMGFAVPASAVQPQSELQSLEFEQTTGVSAVRDEALTEEANNAANEPNYAPEDIVRVSIVLSGKSTLEKGFSTVDIAANTQAMAYRESLQDTQTQVTGRIETAIGEELDVRWNLTLAANIISANVAFGQIETIRNVAGVADVVLETQYEPCVVDEEVSLDPNMATSSSQIGSSAAWAEGYTGAGSRIAVIDTGIDLDHKSFDASAYEYSMGLLAEEQGMTLEEYMEEMNVLTVEEIAEVLPQLNVIGQYYSPDAKAEEFYWNSKIPFGYNYIDMDTEYIEHDFDTASGHGSHVEGIAAANAYVPNGNGTFSKALDTVRVQGVAPDAQLIVMKVFGKMGGAYDSDYMAAIEDAIMLNCDSINLSLGSGNPGLTTNSTYQDLLDSLAETDTVVTMSAGNSGHWAASALHNAPGYIYADDASAYTGGSPGSYTNSLGVASADNAGGFGYYFTVGDVGVLYTETEYSNEPMTTLGGEQEYVFIDGIGTLEDFQALGDVLEGKVAFCFRGQTSFFEKATNAVDCGAIATVVCNNQAGSINMDLTDYRYHEPCVSITQAEALAVRAASTPVTDDAGNVLYYTGKMYIGSEQGAITSASKYYSISSFSSYGVPGSLTLKPEITAPGGNIYSVDGEVKGGQAYVNMSGTSMSAPQVAGMAALVAQYIKAEGLAEKTGLTIRALSQSLLMSTAVPMLESEGRYFPVIRQGAGMANVGAAVQAGSYIIMDATATESWADGKVKAELGEDADRTGVYEITFTLNNLTDKAQQYILSADLFTQGLASDGTYLYMANQTVNLQAVASWTVDGQSVEPPAEVVVYDFNGDNLINVEDVQTLLDYVVDQETKLYNANLADLNGDGEITTNDAYLLLGELSTGLVELPANGSVEITVELSLTEDSKEYLTNDPNGAYIEGYVYAGAISSEEGVKGTCHSIPVLGYYGSWTEPSMYDRGTFIGRLYGDTEPTYISDIAQNYLSLRRADNAENYNHTGNPYVVEETLDTSKFALNPDAVINQINFASIRNAGAYSCVAQDEEGNVVYITNPGKDLLGAYYHVNAGAWQNTGYYITFARTPAAMGFSEGDTMTFSLVMLPEYYTNKGTLTAQQLATMIENGEIGQGAFLSNTFKLDATAPEIGNVYRDLKTGNILVEATDDNDVAIIQVQTLGGRVLAQAVPGEDGLTTIDLSGVQVGTEAIIMVGDYAMNETAYVVELGGKPIDYSGEFYGFTPSSYRGSGYRWMHITPDDLWYYNNNAYSGTENIQNMSYNITAAEYVDGYVFMAASDGYFYVAPHEMWMDATRSTYYKSDIATINDMAFNYADKTMYVLDASNNIWAMDVLTCELTKVGNITVTNPVTGSAASQKRIMGLTIDDNGNFYIVNWGGPTQAFLYTFTLNDFVEGTITDLEPIANYKSGVIGYQFCTGSLAYDHDEDKLYLTGGLFSSGSSSGYLVEVDVNTGKGAKVTQKDGGYGAAAASRMYAAVYGMYVVPSGSAGVVQMVDEASRVELDKTVVEGLVGMETAVQAFVYNWNVRDKSVTWTSSDPSVATVTTAGRVKLLSVGQATITATTNAAPYLTATCTVNVEATPSVELTAMLLDEDNNAQWVEFNTSEPENFEVLAESEEFYYSGDDLDGKIYVHDGSTMYRIDGDTFEPTALSGVSTSWRWSDAAAAPAVGSTFNYMVCLSESGKRLAFIKPETGEVFDNWSMTSYLGSDRMAAIAWAGFGKYDYNAANPNLDSHFYYMITDGGDLWKIIVHTYEHFQFGERSLFSRVLLGNVGVKLSGVSSVTGGKYASMVYDETTGYLILSAYTSGDTNELYAIHPESCLAIKLGDFGEKIWPVVSLHQYDRAEDLTVRMKTPEASIFEGNTAVLKAEVALAEMDSSLTWTSSDPSVAKVDANGKVTGVSAGTAIITATTVEKNDEGKTVSDTATVTVKANTTMDLTVGAQIVTEDGTAKWVTINTATGTYTVDGNASTTFTAAAGHEGKLLGSNCDYTNEGKMFIVDPETFTESPSVSVKRDSGIRDMATAPLDVMDICDYWTFEHYDGEAFGMPLALLDNNKLAMVDTETGKFVEWGLSIWKIDNISALTYMGHTWWDDSYEGHLEGKVYYSIAQDGRLREFITRPVWIDHAYDDSKDYTLSNYTIGHVGMTFDDPYGMSMTCIKDENNYGLLVADTTEDGVNLYWINLKGEDRTAMKLCTLKGATAISGLYTQGDLDGVKYNDNLPTNMNNSFGGDFGVNMTGEKAIVEVSARTGKPIGASEETMDVNAIVPTSTEREDDCVAGNSTLSLMSDLDTTNGLIVVEFDENKVAVESMDTYTDFKSIKVEEGKIIFGYVNNYAMSRESVLADLVFTLKSGKEADVTITVVEDNAFSIGSEEIITLTAPEHDYELSEVVEPTCTEDGYEVYTCSGCGDSYTVTLEAYGHDYEAYVTEPTCTEGGYTTYICANCGDTYVDDVTEAYCPSERFEDIAIDAWYHEAVDYVVESGLMNGMSETTFAPEGKTTRAQLVTVLYRLAGAPETELTAQFKDVADNAWYASAVAWAYENGITTGITEDLFAPGANVTREQVVTFLARYAALTGIEIETEADLSDYTDADLVSEYAVPAMAWAIENGIINGMGDGTLAPKADSTRAQIATILMRFIEG